MGRQVSRRVSRRMIGNYVLMVRLRWVGEERGREGQGRNEQKRGGDGGKL